jgi:TrmH family RNA methyltransferase
MSLIDSPQSKQVKLFKSLERPKGRRESGLYALEGRRLIRQALEDGADLRWAYYCPDKFRSSEDQELLGRLLDRNLPTHEITERALRAMSHTETPSGWAAVADLPAWSVEDLPQERHTLYLGVYEWRDPGNLGTMVRTARALGAGACFSVGDSVDFFDPKVVRASAGAVVGLPLLELPAADALAAMLGKLGARLVVADMEAERDFDAAEYPDRCALLIGSEAHGLPEEIMRQADLEVRVPMPGGGESLNAAVAAGIIAYRVTRQFDSDE